MKRLRCRDKKGCVSRCPPRSNSNDTPLCDRLRWRPNKRLRGAKRAGDSPRLSIRTGTCCKEPCYRARRTAQGQQYRHSQRTWSPVPCLPSAPVLLAPRSATGAWPDRGQHHQCLWQPESVIPPSLPCSIQYSPTVQHHGRWYAWLEPDTLSFVPSLGETWSSMTTRSREEGSLRG